MALPNQYDFDIKFESTVRGVIRDVATLYAAQFNGPGTPYWINFTGITKINN